MADNTRITTAADLTPNTVVLHLLELSRRMGELTDQLDEVERDAVNRREDYTRAYAVAFIRCVGPMDVRKQQALLDTHEERLAAELAEAKVRGMKRQVDTLKVRVEVGRSAAALVRAEAEFLNVPTQRRR